MPVKTSRRTKAQDHTLHSQAQAEALFASIGDGAIAIDADGKIDRINSVACQLLGFNEKELLGKWFPGIVKIYDEDGNALSPMDRPITRALLSGKPVYQRSYYLTRNGYMLPVAVTVSPIVLDGKPIGAIEVFRDITLESEIDKMKSEFITIASHQLRTPLTAIKTYTHMLEEGYGGELTPEQQEFIDVILSSADRMNQLITTLLNIARIETGKMGTESKHTDLIHIITDLHRELLPIAQAKGIDVTMNIPSKPALVMTDPLLIREVFTNLLSNAIKYTPEAGEVRVDLNDHGKHFVFAVRDTGYGVPKGEQKRLFTKFFRAENITGKEPNGTGVGLYLVKRIAENIGGDIRFKSKEGQGSVFYFELPKS